MVYTDIIVEKKGPTAWLILNKPHVMNGMGLQTMKDIIMALDDLERDQTIMVLVIKGAGGTFCAGADFDRQGFVRQRHVWRRFEQRRLCLGCHHY